jgi:hypothetical protein
MIYLIVQGPTMWYLWVLVPWLDLVGLHLLGFYSFKNAWFSNMNQYGMAYHAYLYGTGCLLLLFINLFTENPMWTLSWAWIPIVSWSGAFIIHFLIFIAIEKRRRITI